MSAARKRFPRVSAFVPVAPDPSRDARHHVPVALLSRAFRPFFLGACIWAIASIAPMIAGSAADGLGFAAARGTAWHAHEALFGYGGAIVAGFLLTAVPNWTGRLPLTGWPLLGLFGVWCAGRAAIAAEEAIGPIVVAGIDGVFLPLVLVLTARDVAAARNWRNMKTIALLGLFAAANVGFHVEGLRLGSMTDTQRLGVAALLGLVMLIGGRVAPHVTREWLLRRNAARLPAPFDRLDEASLVGAGAALAVWVIAPDAVVTAPVLLIAAILQSIRLGRWAGLSAWREPLVLILHLGYAFIPLGFLLAAAAAVASEPAWSTAALHAWTVGAIGVTALAVMTRASLGHTGRRLTASPLTIAAYVAVVSAALLRIAAELDVTLQGILVNAAGAAWIAGNAIFLLEYAPVLVARRQAQP